MRQIVILITKMFYTRIQLKRRLTTDQIKKIPMNSLILMAGAARDWKREAWALFTLSHQMINKT